LLPSERSEVSRSALMARVRQRGTKPELLTGAALRSLGLRYRKNVRGLPGTPDFANRSAKWAVFVHGCFWHRHPNCKRTTTPKSNIDFWLAKFEANQSRDERAEAELRSLGFSVIVIWECEAGTEAASRKLQILEACRVDV